MNKKKWRKLYDFDKYQISDTGEVRRTEIRKLHINEVGYNTLNLSQKNKQRKIAVHRAVWEAFKGRIPPDKMINHINGIKTDNRIENLEVVTNRENIEHYKNHLLTYRGEKVNTSKLNEDTVREIRRRYENGVSSNYLAKDYGLAKSSITRIISRKNWRHVE